MNITIKEKQIGFFERNLTFWVLICMFFGVLIGKFLPQIPRRINLNRYDIFEDISIYNVGAFIVPKFNISKHEMGIYYYIIRQEFILRKSIISRTIKTALASLLAIVVSQELSLEFAAAAGIIAILNVFDTRKATIEGGLKRTLSAIIALLIGGFLFEKIGYKTWVFGLYLLLFVPVSFLLKIELGLGPSSVIVTHLLAFGKIDVLIILNEMALVFIGTGFAMLTNFYAPTRQDKLNRLIESIYDDMKFILNLFGESLVQNLDVKLYEDKISELEADIDKAIDIAIIENDNLIENSRDLLFDLRLREREMDLLQEMYDDLRTIPPEYSDGKYISDILIQASQNLTKREDMIKLKERIDFLKNHYHMMELPDIHEEFAIRSAIFQVFRSLDQFIDISNQITKIPNNKIRIKTRG